MPLIPVIDPDGKPSRRRSHQPTVEGRALLGPARFPVGGVQPLPREDEAAHRLPDGSWKMTRFRIARTKGPKS